MRETPARALSAPLPAAPGPLAHETGPDPLTAAQRVLAGALFLPWAGAAAGWAYCVAVSEAWRWIRS